MLSPLIISFRTRSIAGNFILLLIIAISLLLNSCTENDNDTGDYSKQFKAIYDTLDEYKALKKAPLITTRYLDSSFKLMAHPFVNDRFRYYSFHFVYEMKSAHNSKKALLYADSMLLMAKQSVTKHQYQLNYAEANFALGDAYFELSQYSNAYKCYYQGYYIGKSQANYKILAEYTYRMGMVTFKQGHYREAAGYFKISHNQSKSYKDSFRAFYQRQELLANIGESYKNAGMLDSASIFLNNALDFINANNDRYNNLANMLEVARGVVYGNQGDIALLEHRYADAERLLKLSIEINLRKGNDNKDAQLTELKLANLYLDQNRQNDLSAVLKDLRAQLDSIPNYSAEMGFNYLASRYYSNQADNASALKYLKRYSSLKDSVTRLANTLKRTDVTTQQANYDKQNEINALKDNNKRQLIYIYIAVILSIMAIVIVFLVIRNLRKSKQDIQVIRSLNEKINQQKTHLENTLDELNSSSREKDRILRAVAHDLRNPLGGIASLSSAMIDDDYTPEQLDMINLIKDTSYNSLELI
ncbi:MAG TPA: histidine kinase dimerization/phospho-acceptor domain-containing protein, partial [Mucilaginibacter sp.]